MRNLLTPKLSASDLRAQSVIDLAKHKLRKLWGDDALLLPVYVDDSSPVACTGPQGIGVSRRVLRLDPDNVHVYIAHEVFHAVLEDTFLTSKYDSNLVNAASDYKINQLLQELYGYDVKAVRFKGLRNKDYDHLTLAQLCALLAKKSKRVSHFAHSLRHQSILNIAKALRSTLNISFDVDPIKSSALSEVELNAALEYDKFVFPNLPGVDIEVAVKTLARRLYSPVRWNYAAFHKTLTPTQAVSIVPQVTLTEYRSAKSAVFAAFLILSRLSHSGEWSKAMAKFYKSRLDRATFDHRHKLRRLSSASSRTELTLRFNEYSKRLNKRIKFFQSLPSVGELLEKHVDVRVRLPSLSGSVAEVDSDPPVYDKSSELVKLINLHMRYLQRNLDDLLSTAAAFDRIASEFADKPGKQKSSKRLVSKPADGNGKEQRQAGNRSSGKDQDNDDLDERDEQNSDDADGGDGQGSSDVGDGQSHGGSDDTDAGDGQGSSDDTDAGDGQGSSDDVGDGDEESDRQASSLTGVVRKALAKSDSGEGKGYSNEEIEMLHLVANNEKMLRLILNQALQFKQVLLPHKTSRPKEGVVDRSLVYGNSLGNVLGCELARLHTEVARLSFFADLANSNLLQYTDLDSRRDPVILMLDCSSSMAGGAYEVAAGFCLSLVSVLSKEKRSIALIQFSGDVDRCLVFGDGFGATLVELLKYLLTPSYGGTNFGAALDAAFQVHRALNYPKSQALLITDGADSVPPAVLARKPHGMSLSGVQIGGGEGSELHQWCDGGVVHARRSNLGIVLTKAAHAFL